MFHPRISRGRDYYPLSKNSLSDVISVLQVSFNYPFKSYLDVPDILYIILLHIILYCIFSDNYRNLYLLYFTFLLYYILLNTYPSAYEYNMQKYSQYKCK